VVAFALRDLVDRRLHVQHLCTDVVDQPAARQAKLVDRAQGHADFVAEIGAACSLRPFRKALGHTPKSAELASEVRRIQKAAASPDLRHAANAGPPGTVGNYCQANMQ
jgi:hypothetical protein